MRYISFVCTIKLVVVVLQFGQGMESRDHLFEHACSEQPSASSGSLDQ